MTMHPALAVTILLALTGCGESAAPVRSAPAPIGRVAIPTPPPTPRLHTVPGLEGVIGADADSLIRQLGPARLDIREGDARKLQWSGAACILDAYLYPASAGARPVVTYIEARRGDGREVDRVACVAALLKKP